VAFIRALRTTMAAQVSRQPNMILGMLKFGQSDTMQHACLDEQLYKVNAMLAFAQEERKESVLWAFCRRPALTGPGSTCWPGAGLPASV